MVGLSYIIYLNYPKDEILVVSDISVIYPYNGWMIFKDTNDDVAAMIREKHVRSVIKQECITGCEM